MSKPPSDILSAGPSKMVDHWYSNEDLAKRYQVPIGTILDWRRRGVGPKGTKLGRYSDQAVRAWESQRDGRTPH